MKNKFLTFLLLFPAIISLIIMSAHVLRTGHVVLAILLFFSSFLLLIKNKVAARVVQIILFSSGIEWLRTLYLLIQQRLAENKPMARMVIILSAVACVAFLSGLSFFTKSLKSRYKL